MGKPKKRKGKIKIKSSARLKRSNSGIIGVNAPIKTLASNAGIIRVKLKQKA